MVKKHSFARPFEVLIDKREGWNAGDYQITNEDLVWYRMAPEQKKAQEQEYMVSDPR
jgi:hypothetical protein